MKMLSLIALFSLSAFAYADVTSFKGHIYKKADTDLCFKDYDTILKNVQAVNGFVVLDGGCLAYGSEQVRMEFDYVHPLAQRVDELTVKYANAEECQSTLSSSQNDFIKSGNQFVSTNCRGSEQTTYFINTTRSVVTSHKRLGKFETKTECLKTLADLKQKAREFEIFSVMSTCEEITYGASTKKFFSPTLNVIASYALNLEAISGNVSHSCLSDVTRIERNFNNNNVKVVAAFCAGELSAVQDQQEFILYLKPKNSNKYVVEYLGIFTETNNACQAKLPAIVSGLEQSGQNVLYAYCKKISEKAFRPAAVYLKAIE